MKEVMPLEWRYENALVQRFERLPAEVISEITVNEGMLDRVTDPKLLPWFDKDYLRKNASVFALGLPFTEHNHRKQRKLMKEGREDEIEDPFLPLAQTPTSHRAVYFKRDALFTDEYGNAYGEIGAKGTGIAYRDASLLYKDHSDPQGFFGYEHAKQEMEVSEKLAAEGGRVGRVLGIIGLDSEILAEWIKSKSFPLSHEIEHQLDKLQRHEDIPAIIIRLMGTDRLEDSSLQLHFSSDRITARAARLLYREVESRGFENFFGHYRLNPDPQIPYDLFSLGFMSKKQLEKYKKDREYPRAEDVYLQSLNFLSEYFGLWNKAVFKKVSRRDYAGTLSYKGDAQDIDTAGYWYDFETSIANRPQYYWQSKEKFYPTFGHIQSFELYGKSYEEARRAADKAKLDYTL